MTTKTKQQPKITALVPWYGGNRLLAHAVGEQLVGCRWVGIPFAGGMPELAHVSAPTIVVNDLHRAVINLAATLADRRLGPRLIRHLRRLLFHPGTLADAQGVARAFEASEVDCRAVASDPRMRWAEAYFVSQWMGRSGVAGTPRELDSSLPVRWNANGGDSNRRYRSAVESLKFWRSIMERCNFCCMDAFEFLGAANDLAECGIYCDPPFPEGGERYRHTFSQADHERLAARLSAFDRARVVCRFYDHELIRRLYPLPAWQWIELEGGRKQTNEAAPEVLVVRNGR